MKTYLVRALHYFIKIIVILVLAFGVLYLLESLLDGRQLLMDKDLMLYTLLYTPKGWVVIGLILGLSAIYPLTSFTRVEIAGDFAKERAIMDRAMEDLGFRLVGHDSRQSEYRVKSLRKQLFSQFDDKITVSGNDRYITVSGMKKDVVRVEAYFMHHRKEFV